jgi:competence protein ComEA
MPDEPREPQKTPPGGILRRGDQIVLATLVLLGLGGILFWWGWRGGGQGGLVEIDRAEPGELTFQVDVNSADWPELSQLPGIGETLARRIVAERRRDGLFVEVEDIPRRVPGIGPKKFERMKLYLCLRPASQAAAAK